MSAMNVKISEAMSRVGAGDGRVSVEMTHEQFAAIATALVFASVDPYLTDDVKAEYAKVRELFITAPIVGLED